MVKTATLNYGYANDDILNDAISTISSVFNAIGEIIGPLFGGFVTDYAGSHTSFNVAALMTFMFAIVFAVGTDTFYSLFEKKQSISIANLCQGCPSQFAEYLVSFIAL